MLHKHALPLACLYRQDAVIINDSELKPFFVDYARPAFSEAH